MNRFFWDEVTVIKIIARKKKSDVCPKRLTCFVGLNQMEDTMLAMTKITKGRRAGEIVK